MKVADIAKEFFYPFTQLPIVLAALFFWIIYTVAHIAITFVPIAGLIGAVMLTIWALPAFFRYLLFTLEARSNGSDAPAFDAELFGLADKLWSLAPLVLVAILIWGGIAVADFGAIAVAAYGTSVMFLMPASIAILAVTQSPLESLNPRAIFRMVKICGPAYALIPAIFVALSLSIRWLASLGVTPLLIEWLVIYEALLLFTLTGAILHAKEVPHEVALEAPLAPSEEDIASDLEKEREKIVSHAYGIISRGNREGGFAHILDWIKQEPDVDDASQWFFAAMMKWEVKEPALFYAQIYFSHLVHHDYDMRALKLISTCLHIDPQWRPKAEDRSHALSLAEKYHRDDLVKFLRN